jgi:hypothetical protein
VPCFLPVPVSGREANGHGEAAKWYQVQIDGRNVSGHDGTVKMASKKQGTSASADSANDAVLVD